MKILYVHQYFRTPETGGGLRSYYLAKELVGLGHEVEMITAYNGSGYKHEIVEGFSVHYLPVYYDNKLGARKRMWAFLKFAVLAIKQSQSIRDADLCYVMTTPLSTGFVGLYCKWILKVPYVFEVGDLWPKVPMEMGALKHPLVVKLWLYLEKLFYNQAIGLVGLSPDITAHMEQIDPGKPTTTVTNVADCKYFFPSENPKRDINGLKLKDTFVVTYAGTLGRANHLSYMIDVAEICQDINVQFLVVGEGAEREFLIEEKERRLLKNIEFVEFQDRDGVKAVLDNSDAVYLSFLSLPTLCTGSPNKFFDGLASGKMITSNFQGWTKDIINQHKLGFVYDPLNPDAFKVKLEHFMQNEILLSKAKTSARELAMSEYSLEILSRRLEAFLVSLRP